MWRLPKPRQPPLEQQPWCSGQLNTHPILTWCFDNFHELLFDYKTRMRMMQQRTRLKAKKAVGLL
jgi:hypothetical protein